MNPPIAFIENFERFTKIVQTIRHELLAYHYSFLDEAEFKKMLTEDVPAGNRAYVGETLFRAHFSALTAILRNHRWMYGLDAAMKYPNYFSFCACLRGLVEASADAHDTLQVVLPTLIEHFESLRSALRGEFSEGIFVCEPLEDILIHYTHGRKIAKDEVFPPSHRAKTMQEYLATIEEPKSHLVRELYAELCEVTHPAASTVHFFSDFDPIKNNFHFEEPEDMALVVGLLQRHDEVFAPLFQKSFNAALLILFILNRFGDSRFFTPGAENIDFSCVPIFTEIQRRLSAVQ